MGTRIERLNPRDGLNERPLETEHGYESSTRIRRIDTTSKISRSCGRLRRPPTLWNKDSVHMGFAGKRASLISSDSLKIVRS